MVRVVRVVWVVQVAQVIQVVQVVFMVVNVVQGVQIVQVISLNGLHPQNLWSTQDSPTANGSCCNPLFFCSPVAHHLTYEQGVVQKIT